MTTKPVIPERPDLVAIPQARRTALSTVSTTLPVSSPNLPLPITPTIGREREVAALIDLIHQPEIRLLTLTGTGGVGKTRLALHVTTEIWRDFPAGIWYVPLTFVRDPALVLSAIAQALDVREAGHRSLLEGITHALREQKALLILDNFEHVVEAAPLVSELLTRCPQLTCLVTSRALLRVSGEHAYPVAPLALPAAAPAETAAETALSPAIQLFVSRAQEVRPDFELTDANAGAITAICRRLDGLPLAIELAAARVRHLTPAELATRLLEGKEGAALAVLTGGPRDAPSRQQTLRYAIGWSHDLLSPEERQVFRRLAIFVGGFTLESAEYVGESLSLQGEKGGRFAPGGGGENGYSPSSPSGRQAAPRERSDPPPFPSVIDCIAALVDQSLLQTAEEAPGGLSRYEMLETVREYALEHLAASGEEAAVRDAHAAYFVSLAERAAPLLSTEQQRTWLERLQVEQANLRIALARSEQRDNGDALRLAAALWRFWHRRGSWAEGRSWLDRLLAAAGDGGDLTVRATALTGAAWLAHYQNDYATAQTAAQEAIACFRRLHRTDGLIEILHCQALVAQSLGQNQRAADLSEEALALARSLADPGRTAESLCYLSRATRELGDYARATTLGQEALAIQQHERHRGGMAAALMVLGDVARDLGEPGEVRARCEESLAISRELGDPLGEGFSLHNLAVAAYGEGQLELARSLGEESLAIFRRGDVQSAMAEVLASLGPILAAAGHFVAALAALKEALLLAGRAGPRWEVAGSLEGIARIAVVHRQERVAVELAGRAAALRLTLGVPVRPNWYLDLEQALDAARAALGPAGFAATWETSQELPFTTSTTGAGGQVLELDETLAEALDILEQATRQETPRAIEQVTPHGLTEREVEVLRLLAAGNSNREIGELLYISPTTAARHVANIFNKLGVDSRARAAAYAHRFGLI